MSRGYYFDAFYDDVIVRLMDRLSVLARRPEALLAKMTLDKSADAVRWFRPCSHDCRQATSRLTPCTCCSGWR